MQGRLGAAVREGFGQSETAALVGNTPGRPVQSGSMGTPAAGVRRGGAGSGDRSEARTGDEGELCLRLAPVDAAGMPLGRPLGSDGRLSPRREPHRADHVRRLLPHPRHRPAGRRRLRRHVGRADEVFKAADVRISPFELETVLVAHPAVAEAAVVPSPDPALHAVPKAFVVLAPGLGTDGRDRGRDPASRPAQPLRAQPGHPAGVRRAAQDDGGQGAPGDPA